MRSVPDFLKEEYPFQGKFITTTDGHQQHYLDEFEGEGEGPALVMAHGNPTWSFYYRNLVKAFKKTHRVIVPDHIGCGLSDKPQDYSYRLKDHIDNLENLIESLSLEEVNLVVHDWGGAIGFGYAARHPDKVKKIVILNTAAFTSKRIPARIGVCKIPVFGEFIVRNFNAFAYPATFMAATKKLSETVKKGYLLPYNNYTNRIATSRFVQDIPLHGGHPSHETLLGIEKSLSKIKAKKMILWGKKDFCFNEHFYDRWREIYPEADAHLFPDGNHYILEDEKEAVIDKMTSFLGASS